jgi:membrane-associated phospholipid phosphatase
MYLAGKLGTFFDRRGHTVKLLPVILPLLLATFIAVTRVDNYWHHWFDVFAGGLLGKSVLLPVCGIIMSTSFSK